MGTLGLKVFTPIFNKKGLSNWQQHFLKYSIIFWRIFLKCSLKIPLGCRKKAKLMIQILIRPSYFGLGSVHTRQTVLAFMVKTPSCCAGLIGETALFLVSTAWRRRIFLKLRIFGSYCVGVAPLSRLTEQGNG